MLTVNCDGRTKLRRFPDVCGDRVVLKNGGDLSAARHEWNPCGEVESMKAIQPVKLPGYPKDSVKTVN